MRLAVQNVFDVGLRDVTHKNARFVTELGFKGVGAHLNCPADTISDATIDTARGVIANHGLAWLQ